MQIHELNTFAGTPGAGDFLAIDNGEETRKVPASSLIPEINPYQTYYGVSETPASSSTKTVTCSDFVLVTGAMIAVKFTNTNSVVKPSMNVNSTGAKTIKTADGSTDSIANAWAAGAVVLFVYDGTSWILVSAGMIPTISETFSISRTGGATGSSVNTSATSFVRYGKIVSCLLAINPATVEIAAGGNIFEGTLNTLKLRPAAGTGARLIAYMGSRPIVCQIGDSGTIIVRNTSATALTMGGALYLNGIYLTD